MKTMIASIALLASVSSFAESINCKSKDYGVIVKDGRANYSVKSYLNDSADVFISQKTVTKNILAIALEVDGQKDLFEVSASRVSPGVFKGTLFMGNLAQAVSCTVKK